MQPKVVVGMANSVDLVLQIRRDNRDNLVIISRFLCKNVFGDQSLELSRRDGSNEGSQHMLCSR